MPTPYTTLETDLDPQVNTTEIDTSRLEDLLGDECKCESWHTARANKVCSEEVTHRLTWDCRSETLLVCWNQYKYTTSRMNGYWTCWGCHRNTEDCWTIIPV